MRRAARVSVLFNEPKLLKYHTLNDAAYRVEVSVLFNEPKLLKSNTQI